MKSRGLAGAHTTGTDALLAYVQYKTHDLWFCLHYIHTSRHVLYSDFILRRAWKRLGCSESDRTRTAGRGDPAARDHPLLRFFVQIGSTISEREKHVCVHFSVLRKRAVSLLVLVSLLRRYASGRCSLCACLESVVRFVFFFYHSSCGIYVQERHGRRCVVL